jgi:putative GTP pyrophosphokinase
MDKPYPQIMKFTSLPNVSKNQINKAGKFLSGRKRATTDELRDAILLVSNWRAAHAYPINTYQATLRTKLKSKRFTDFIVAQRLKRLPTIIDKLKRQPTMQLGNMQDIGGLRAILNSKNDVYKLFHEYDTSYFKDSIEKKYDYIENPRDEDGYRSLHLVFSYKNKQNPAYDGLHLEMQIRTQLQHTWATAVETMGTFLGQSLKTKQGEQKWIDFFALVSSAFAHREKCNPIPRFSHLSKADTFKKVIELEKELDVINKIDAFGMAMDIIMSKKEKGTSYYLIILDSLNLSVQVRRYDRYSFEKAASEYSELEAKISEGEKLDVVLVSAGKIESLKNAYPNFFLDTSDFSKALVEILSGLW